MRLHYYCMTTSSGATVRGRGKVNPKMPERALPERGEPFDTNASVHFLSGVWRLQLRRFPMTVAKCLLFIFPRANRHFMEFRFAAQDGNLVGWLRVRMTCAEIPLEMVRLDASSGELMLAIQAPPLVVGLDTSPCALCLKRVGSNFEGYWVTPAGAAVGPRLTLQRAQCSG